MSSLLTRQQPPGARDVRVGGGQAVAPVRALDQVLRDVGNALAPPVLLDDELVEGRVLIYALGREAGPPDAGRLVGLQRREGDLVELRDVAAEGVGAAEVVQRRPDEVGRAEDRVGRAVGVTKPCVPLTCGHIIWKMGQLATRC